MCVSQLKVRHKKAVPITHRDTQSFTQVVLHQYTPSKKCIVVKLLLVEFVQKAQVNLTNYYPPLGKTSTSVFYHDVGYQSTNQIVDPSGPWWSWLGKNEQQMK